MYSQTISKVLNKTISQPVVLLQKHHFSNSKLISSSSSSNVIGVDLGTTNSAVAIVQGDRPLIIENDEGKRTTPSIVAFVKDKSSNKPKILVGESAKRQQVLNSQNTFFATKRLIGRRFSDEEVQRDLKNVSYKIVENPDNNEAMVQVVFASDGNDKESIINYSPAQIGGFILQKMRTFAESFLNNQKVKHAVVTVPAYFNDSQRQATKDAGKLVGLNILRVINEPTAAALAYGLDKQRNDGLVAVYDLGGGTFDISILDINKGVFEVVATNGDTHLGGEDFDLLLMNYVVDHFKSKTGVDLYKNGNKTQLQRIKDACEACKIQLSKTSTYDINLPFIHGSSHLDLTITETQLDELSMNLINKTMKGLNKALRDAELEPEDIDEVLLVGGMTRMPKIRTVVTDFFGKPVNTTVNPDEAVALGAAIQGAVLSGEIKDILLLDVTPLTLGIETYGGIYSPLIPRNTTIPTKKTQMFSTAVDGQTGVDISVYQGERPLVKENKLIGHFKLSNIPVLAKGEPQIMVTFDIDADGIIKVSAKERKTGQDASITVSDVVGRLSDQEIEKIIKDAESNKESDKQKSIILEHATRSDLMVDDTKNVIAKLQGLIEKSDPTVRQDVEKLKTILNDVSQLIEKARNDEKVDAAELKEKTDHIQKFSMEIFNKLAKVQKNLNQLVAFGSYVKSQIPSKQFNAFLIVSIFMIFAIGISGLVGLTYAGYIAPWTGRFYSLWDTNYAKIHIPIIASVSEHQPTAWPAFFFDNQFLIWLFPVGVYLLFQDLKDEHIFVIVYSVLCSYFAGVMVRLMLTLTPIICVCAAIAISKLFDVYLSLRDVINSKDKSNKFRIVAKLAVIVPFGLYLTSFVYHCTWVTSNAYSSPSVVLASRNPDGSQHLIDDYREAYYWLRMNTPEDAKVMAWWDYGYQIGGMADRTTLVDNNTWNNTHIATVGKAMCSSEEVSYEILQKHDVDYVLIIFGGLIGYSGDDLNKYLWMVRIAQGIWPDEVHEQDYFTSRGEYRVDDMASETMKNSLMYKMSFYNFVDLFNGQSAVDRVRNQRLSAGIQPKLDTLEEAFTSENWIVRIYKVKDLDKFGRDLKDANSFESAALKGKKKRVIRRPDLDLRV